ncbi:AAA family ATPase [Trichloromonas sp.]|uniref:AAA family ATPase n=1 Tax=Trichloromonas sp. TaxID=3069249 RepID=UPI002A3D71DE|nr:AAA family ATPase [Trichloromonas sp.]
MNFNELKKMTTSNFEFDNITLNVLRSNGRSKNPEDINMLEIFYQKYNNNPNLYRIISNSGHYFDWDKIEIGLRELYPDIKYYFKDAYYNLSLDKQYNREKIYDFGNGVICLLSGGIPQDFYLINHNVDNVNLICSDNLFLVNGEFDDFHKIIELFNNNIIEEVTNITIGMVSYDDGNFYVKDFDINNKKVELVELDLHYGDGFIDFNDKLLERLNNDTKGLTLFHGVAGSGKTTYIRYLLRKIKELNKDNNVLYFPPTMVDSITDPSFINFISDWVSDSKGKNYIFIEDAEPLLESRYMTRNIGITNLLNLTDGLLNDILNIQVIATFNTSPKNIDLALLRPERLTARKEFRKVKGERLKKLLEFLNIDISLSKDEMTLAEIYSLKKNTKTITHDVDGDSKKIGFGG